jgi:hypothetical protein
MVSPDNRCTPQGSVRSVQHVRTVRAASTARAVGPEDPYGFNPSQQDSLSI